MENIRSRSLRVSLQGDVLQHSSGLAARESQDPSAHREQALGAVGATSNVVPQRSTCCGPVSRGTREPARQAGQPGSPQLTLRWCAPRFLGCSSEFMGPGGATGEGGAVTAVQPCAQPPFPSLSAALRWFQVQLGLGGKQAGLMGTEGWPFRDPGLAGGQGWSCAGTSECPLLRDSSNTPSRDSLLRCGGWESLHGGDTGNAAAEGGEGQPHVQWTLAGSGVGGGVCV